MQFNISLEEWTSHVALRQWIEEQIVLCTPREVHLCSGSEDENEGLLHEMVQMGTLIRLNKEKYPNCYLARSSTADVARVESRTFICSEKREDAGPTNNWEDPAIMKAKLMEIFKGCMYGRTMYVIPFSMGPIGSPFSAIGIQITDSAYAVANMRIMTRMGLPVLQALGTNGVFVPAMHTVGQPLLSGKEDAAWPQNDSKYICHFPETKEIWSFGSGYGGNALLGKKCYALRIASVMGKQDGWLAEHMLIMGVTNPEGVKKYFAAAFPSACGKTNLSMLVPSLPRWKVEVVGDDIAWIRLDADGTMRAINPEAGYFGVAPGTSEKTNPMAMATMSSNTIYTNVAIDGDDCPWWEGKTSQPPANIINWLRKKWTPGDEVAAHPNSRFTTPASQCPIIDPNWESPEGVPLAGIIFGSRRSDTIPLVAQALSWNHGVYMGATMMSETTAAAEGARGVLRSDPFAMLPFCGYHMGDYFKHWIKMGVKAGAKAPQIFCVNWFRKDAKKQFMWPGFGDNIRVIEWMFKRCMDRCRAIQTPIGYLPEQSDLNTKGLFLSNHALSELFELNEEEWRAELQRRHTFLKSLGDRCPKELLDINHNLYRQLDD
uniref:phosphoenolpyruvate carboxykinase (GTP) n=1 Tax=viral metagenome TaxID=1070528 RepID=A0A6C0KVQ3_9ZZZZ